ALGVIRTLLEAGTRLPLFEVFSTAHLQLAMQVSGKRLMDDRWDRYQSIKRHDLVDPGTMPVECTVRVGVDAVEERLSDVRAILDFFADRLKVTLKDQGKRHDLVDAVFALGDDDLVRIVARVEALDAFLKTDDGKNLLAGYKRASNILKAEEKKGWKGEGEAELLPNASEPEVALHDALRLVRAPLANALKAEDFTAAMQELAGLRGPVDAFLDGVFVNSDVAAERDSRLKTLAAVRDAMGQVADFSLIGG
ncbi:MAG: glycine--tRNA ligase subunit beta, partial [Caulobacter sp.]|nr:glycine--tRNA ligase subunit beta [Caulobacter sp.]